MGSIIKSKVITNLLILLIAAACASGRNSTDWINDWLNQPSCSPPCWGGIIPEITTLDKTIERIKAIDGVSNPIINDIPEKGTEISWTFEGSKDSGKVWLENGSDSVSWIRLYLNPSHKLNAIVEYFPEPSKIYFKYCIYVYSMGICSIDIIYYNTGMILSVITPAITWGRTECAFILKNTPVESITFLTPGFDLFGYYSIRHKLITILPFYNWKGYTSHCKD